MSLNKLKISPTPSNTSTITQSITPTGSQCPTNTPTSSNTPTITPTSTNTPTITSTNSPTPSATYCSNPQIIITLEATSANTRFSGWIASQSTGGLFRGFSNGFALSSTLSTYEKELTAYLNFSGWGINTYTYEIDTPVSPPPNQPLHTFTQTIQGNTWITWFLPSCIMEGCYYTKEGFNGGSFFNVNATNVSKEFYYSGGTFSPGYYRMYSSFTASNSRISSGSYTELSGKTCPTPTPTSTPTLTPTPSTTPNVSPTNTNTPTQTPSISPTQTSTPPSVSPTNTPSMTMTNTETPTQTQTPSVSPTNTNTPTIQPTSTQTPSITPSPSETPSGQLFIYGKYVGSTQEVGYTINSGTYIGIGDPTSSCNYMTTISGLQIGDVLDFMTIGTCAIAGDLSNCPSGTGGCNYQHTFNGTGYIYLTIDASNCC